MDQGMDRAKAIMRQTAYSDLELAGRIRCGDADAFRILTRPEQATGLIDVNTIRSRVAEVDVFKNFLKGYRTRQAQAPAPVVN